MIGNDIAEGGNNGWSRLLAETQTFDMGGGSDSKIGTRDRRLAVDIQSGSEPHSDSWLPI